LANHRPTPPVVEMCTVEETGEVLALLLDLPEPLPWERMGWSLTGPGDGDAQHPVDDLMLAASADGCRAILVREGGAPFARR